MVGIPGQPLPRRFEETISWDLRSRCGRHCRSLAAAWSTSSMVAFDVFNSGLKGLTRVAGNDLGAAHEWPAMVVGFYSVSLATD